MPFGLIFIAKCFAFQASTLPVSTCCNGMEPAPTPSCYGIQTGGFILLSNSTGGTITIKFQNNATIILKNDGEYQTSSLLFSKTYLNNQIDGTYVVLAGSGTQIAHGYFNLLNGMPATSNQVSWCVNDVPSAIWCGDNGYQNVCNLDGAGHFLFVSVAQLYDANPYSRPKNQK